MNEETGKIAFDLNERVKNTEETRRFLLQKNIIDLDLIEEGQLYKDILGDPEATWKAYLSQLEVFYTRAEVLKHLKAYRKLTKMFSIDQNKYFDLPSSRIVELLPIVTAENAQEWFDRARTLVPQDWKIEIRKAKGLITSDQDHAHTWHDYKECAICGLKAKHGQDTEIIAK